MHYMSVMSAYSAVLKTCLAFYFPTVMRGRFSSSAFKNHYFIYTAQPYKKITYKDSTKVLIILFLRFVSRCGRRNRKQESRFLLLFPGFYPGVLGARRGAGIEGHDGPHSE
jgi:hypothetical protein